MKKTIIIFSFIIACLFIFSDFNIESIIETMEEDTLLYYFDNNKDILDTLIKGNIDFNNIDYNDKKFFVILDMQNNLKRIIPIKHNDTIFKGTYIGIGELFYEHFMDDSALVYFKKSFETFNNGDAYHKYINLYSEKGNNVIEEMELFNKKYGGNKKILLVNALKFYELGLKNESVECLRQGTEVYDTSSSFLNMLILRIYRDKAFLYNEKKQAIKYALINFEQNPNLYYIIDYIDDYIETTNTDFGLDKYIKNILKNKNAHFENKFTAAVYFVNRNKYIKECKKVLYECLNNNDYKIIYPYIHLYISKAEYKLKNYKKALEHIEYASEDSSLIDKEYYELKFNIDLQISDRDIIMNDAIHLLSLDPYNEKIINILKSKYSPQEYIDIKKRVRDFIQLSIDTINVDSMLCYNMNNDTIKLKDAGTVLFIELFSTWCGYCTKSISIINQIKDSMPNVRIMAITSEHNQQLLKDYIKEHKINYEIFTDINVYNILNEDAIPVFYIIYPETGECFRFLGYSKNMYNLFKSRIEYFNGEL